MTFAHTERQLLAGTKDVTRRLGWKDLRPGDRFLAVRKARGVPKRERVELGTYEVVSVRREAVEAVTDGEVAREGFPDRDAAWFVRFFCEAMRVRPQQRVTRIEFRRVTGPEA